MAHVNGMYLSVVNEDGYKYSCEIRSFMNTDYYCHDMDDVLDLMKEYEIDVVLRVRFPGDREVVLWDHWYTPPTWVESYSEKARNDFYKFY